MSKISNDEMTKVRLARWEGWKQLAKQLPNHHILSVELVRTRNDETAAVITVVRHHHPVQFLVRADSRGRVKANQTDPGCDDGRDHGGHGHGHGHGDYDGKGGGKGGQAGSRGVEAVALAATAAPMAAAEDPVDPNVIALGQPPQKEPPTPGILALGSALLGTAFDLGEQLPGGGSAPQ
jgi:hypothetical protein